MRHLLRSIIALSALALPFAAHADTFSGTATFSDISNSHNNTTNFSGVFEHSPFSFSGGVGTTFHDDLTITTSGAPLGLFASNRDRVAVSINFTSPNLVQSGFAGTATDIAIFDGIFNGTDIDWNSNRHVVRFTDGSSVRLDLPNFSYVGLFSPFSGTEDLTITVLTAATPEPSGIALLGTGLLGAVGAARRRFSR